MPSSRTQSKKPGRTLSKIPPLNPIKCMHPTKQKNQWQKESESSYLKKYINYKKTLYLFNNRILKWVSYQHWFIIIVAVWIQVAFPTKPKLCSTWNWKKTMLVMCKKLVHKYKSCTVKNWIAGNHLYCSHSKAYRQHSEIRHLIRCSPIRIQKE